MGMTTQLCSNITGYELKYDALREILDTPDNISVSDELCHTSKNFITKHPA